MPSVLAYWDIRGIAQPIRLLLNYVGEEFEDKQYVRGPAPAYRGEEWLSEKFTLGLDFPNLPYYIDGDVQLTQSNAILRYLGRKYNMCGSTEAERMKVDMVTDQVMDLRNGFVRLCYNPNFNDLVENYKKELPAKLKVFDDFLGGKQFSAGDNAQIKESIKASRHWSVQGETGNRDVGDECSSMKCEITFPDFHLYEMLDQHKHLVPSCLDDFSNLQAFMGRFEALPNIKRYMESDKFMKKPLNNRMAKFGSKF